MTDNGLQRLNKKRSLSLAPPKRRRRLASHLALAGLSLVDNNHEYATINDLPEEILFIVFHYLPKNLAFTLLYPPDEVESLALTIKRRTIPHFTKSWLFSQVFVCDPSDAVYNWQNEFSNQWLMVPQALFIRLPFTDFDWGVRDVLFESHYSPWESSQPHECDLQRNFISVYFQNYSTRYMIAPASESSPSKFFYQSPHLSRLMLPDICPAMQKYRGRLRVDSLRLGGSHDNIDGIVNLGLVKQLSVLTDCVGVYKHASQFTSLTDLFIRYHDGSNEFIALADSVTRLVLSVPCSTMYYSEIAALAANFKRLTYCEVTSRVGFINWPRIWRKPDSNQDTRRNQTHHIGALAFKQMNFDKLETLMLDDHPYKVVRVNGRWDSSEEVTNNSVLAGNTWWPSH
ncbi:hypothetical protein DIURU_001795 [Diutina rugosa]|uniref:F-box domain-containing protein n=1 Tax=Diutina rugosa TaxID=5481 RepID=A0A642UUW4_DIURU|nr:uncharacterized protein DIURU_001795 [Diutina rugosa]KAA8904841.1 hypothetical protein DIURU_001795 [Diutina rugosa]